MGKLIDLTGQRFGRLVVWDRAENNKQGRAMWRCRCDCGKDTVVSGTDLHSGTTKSCGCLRIIRVGETHRHHGGTKSRLFRIWSGMHTRCYNRNVHNFNDYGGRGITICDEWLYDFAAFRDWAMAHGYQDNLSIDRIDNDKGYSPENCRWVSGKVQRANQRPHKSSVTRVLCAETGRVYESISEAAKSTGISIQSISYCINGKQKHAGGYTWRAADKKLDT